MSIPKLGMDKRAASLPPCVKGWLSGHGGLWVGGTGLRCPAGGLALVVNCPLGPHPHGQAKLPLL